MDEIKREKGNSVEEILELRKNLNSYQKRSEELEKKV